MDQPPKELGETTGSEARPSVSGAKLESGLQLPWAPTLPPHPLKMAPRELVTETSNSKPEDVIQLPNKSMAAEQARPRVSAQHLLRTVQRSEH